LWDSHVSSVKMFSVYPAEEDAATTVRLLSPMRAAAGAKLKLPRLRSARWRRVAAWVAAVLLAVVSGSSMALFAVLTKGVVEVFGHGLETALRTPELYAWIAIALGGMVFQQAAFRAGALSASLPTMTVAKPVVAWLLGIAVLGESLHPGGETMFVVGAGVVVTIVATAALARGEAVAVEAGTEGDVEITDQSDGSLRSL